MKSTEQTTPSTNPEPDATVRVRVADPTEQAWFDQQMADRHYLGAGRPVGDYLRQIVELHGRPAALLVWGPACYALKDRDRWIGWSANHRIERLKLVVQNRRFLILGEKGASPNLASQTMGAALRRLPEQWQQGFGYRPLLAETFTDPEAFAGTCYKASNWQPVGTSAGYSRHRADFYVPNDRPKKLWLYELGPRARQQLQAVALPDDSQAGVIAPPSGVIPVSQLQMLSLLELLRRAPDPRGKNTRLRIGPVLAIVALALLAGRRDISEIARFAQTLSQAQRRHLGLPRKKGAQAFWQVPTYSVFYQVLTRMDSEAFARLLDAWFRQQAGSLPQALALDGKMIRERIGILTLAQHEDGAPVAVAVYDQKKDTPRCEQTAATALLKNLPALDGRTITADPLHCQKPNAALIVGKGGEYLLQVKGNQPALLKQAEACNAMKDTPLFLTTDTGHGRTEQRGLHAFPLEPDAAGFAGARSLVVVRSEVYTKKTGGTTRETRFYLSSLEPEERTPAQWHQLVRGHWAGVESRNHWRRDHLWREDGSRTNKVHALANLALLRNALLTLTPVHYPELPLKQVLELLHSDPAACLRVIR